MISPYFKGAESISGLGLPQFLGLGSRFGVETWSPDLGHPPLMGSQSGPQPTPTDPNQRPTDPNRHPTNSGWVMGERPWAMGSHTRWHVGLAGASAGVYVALPHNNTPKLVTIPGKLPKIHDPSMFGFE